MISEGLRSNSTLTDLDLSCDEKEQGNRRSNKGIKEEKGNYNKQ